MESDPKTILLFSDWYLPGYKAGGPITSCANLVAHLGDDFNFKVVCSDRDYLETEPYLNVTTDRWVKVGKAHVMYLSPSRQGLKAIKEILSAVNPDLVYLNGMFSKTFTIFPLIALHGAAMEVVVAPRGMLAPAAMAIKSFKKTAFLKSAKFLRLFSKVKFHATNGVESEQIVERFGEVPIEVVPNIPGVPLAADLRSEHKKKKGALRLYSVARIAPEKNIHFALECLRLINPAISVHFEIIGAVYDQAYFSRCKRIIESLPPNVKVIFSGTMPQRDITRIAAKADFFFLPTAGENYGHAIVEAFLTGVPVVISNLTPWLNLEEASLGFDLELAHEKFAQILNQLGAMAEEEYNFAYKNVKVNAEAMINLDKLHNGYKNLFDD
ncbi:MAG TPA: glycosyltransferase family 4 protein [Cryomorphaceae bacterium]|nr:glycosyltransferase family 4 protein [Cryomorphaceae bacterium]